ncbi:MAG TPA: hypothetical protein DEA97_05705 [Bacteroidales bacterium]|nr:hypothetical protein [Bacteroidales bacterium]
MKKIILILLCSGLIFGTSSCAVFLVNENPKQHKGWYKNSNNPHHPNTTNPGKAKQNKKGRKK